MLGVDEFSRAVAEIYASSMDPANWPAAMTAISRALNATGSGLVLGTANGPSVTLGAGMPADAIASYEQYYHSIDHILHACRRSPVGLIRGGQEINAGKTRSEFYTDWQSRYELDDGLFVQLSAGPAPASFAISAPKRSDRFDTPQRVHFVSALIPHLRQALRTQDHLTKLGNAATRVAEVVDAVHHGIIIIDVRHEVVHLNSAADHILKSNDGLCMRSRTIHAAGIAANQQLQKAITNALVGSRSGVRRGGSTACGRPSGKRPYIVHLTPLAARPADPSSTEALVMIIDPEQVYEPPKELIQRLFGLTSAEADVALRTMRGNGLKPISADLEISRATVNTHLQHVFGKTGTHRQAELVRLLLAILP